MEFSNVRDLSIFDKNCLGCVRHGGDFMLSFHNNEKQSKDRFLDVFLTKEQLKYLVEVAEFRLKD